jgi:hypothetical protein
MIPAPRSAIGETAVTAIVPIGPAATTVTRTGPTEFVRPPAAKATGTGPTARASATAANTGPARTGATTTILVEPPPPSATPAPPAPPPSKRSRGIKTVLAALATGALLVAGNALVGGAGGGPFHFGADTADRATPLAAPPAPANPVPQPQVAPSPRPVTPPTTSARPKPRTSDASGDTSLANCTKKVTTAAALTQALSGAGAGDKICATGNMGSRLTVSKGGTAAAPVRIVGNGSTVVKGITVNASYVQVSGFSVLGAKAPGIAIKGSNITVSHNTVKHPTGGDFDGMRFFGNNLKILNNRITDISPDGGKAHADCMQTFQNGTPSSKNVTISGNRCERVSNMCLMAEGPGDLGDGGEGEGESSNWTFSNNYCDNNASQALMIEAVQNVTVTGNQVVGKVDKAFAFDVGSTGAKVGTNKIGPGIGYVVGMDSTSKKGYQGPAIGGGP